MLPCYRHTLSRSSTKYATSSFDQPSVNRHTATAHVPPTINGRLLPYGPVLWSEIMPMIGCMINPDSGPAIQTWTKVESQRRMRWTVLLQLTRDMPPLLRPSASKKGLAYVCSVPWTICQRVLHRRSAIMCTPAELQPDQTERKQEQLHRLRRALDACLAGP